MQETLKEDWGSFPNDDKSDICKKIRMRLQKNLTDQEWECFYSSLNNAAESAPKEATVPNAKVGEESSCRVMLSTSTFIDATVLGVKITKNSRYAPLE
jgi:hypothetical protein